MKDSQMAVIWATLTAAVILLAFQTANLRDIRDAVVSQAGEKSAYTRPYGNRSSLPVIEKHACCAYAPASPIVLPHGLTKRIMNLGKGQIVTISWHSYEDALVVSAPLPDSYLETDIKIYGWSNIRRMIE